MSTDIFRIMDKGNRLLKVSLLLFACLPISVGAQETETLAELQDNLAELEERLSFQKKNVHDGNLVCVVEFSNELRQYIPVCLNKFSYVQLIIKRAYESRTPNQSELIELFRNELNLSAQIKNQIRDTLIPDLEKEIANIKITIKDKIAGRDQDGPGNNSASINKQDIDNLSSQKNTGPQCPDRNPDTSSNEHRFDTNNNPSDQTYIDCRYYKDGYLQNQIPYEDGKKDGVQLGFIKYKECGGRFVNRREILRNGKRVFWWTYSCNKKTGNVYKLSLAAYSNGIPTNTTTWHSNGTKATYSEYKPNGAPDIKHNYNKEGKFLYCTQWNSKGNPNPCSK